MTAALATAVMQSIEKDQHQKRERVKHADAALLGM